MTKFQMEEPVTHLLHPSCVKLLTVALGRLLKSNVYIDKRGKALKETDPETVELHQFKTVQGKQNATVWFIHLSVLNVSACLNSL